MIAIKPSYEIVNEPDWDQVLINLEKAIRTCYKSEKAITTESAETLIRNIIKREHESTLEHAHMTVRFVIDRGVSHEFVRHRHCSFSQESTRYVDYSPKSSNCQGDMKFIMPCWMDNSYLGSWCNDNYNNAIQAFDANDPSRINDLTALRWINSCLESQFNYNYLRELGWGAEHARSVLPNSLKTELVVTTNMRDWRHLFGLRADTTAHPQMLEVIVPLLKELHEKCPTLFDSVPYTLDDFTIIKKRKTKNKK